MSKPQQCAACCHLSTHGVLRLAVTLHKSYNQSAKPMRDGPDDAAPPARRGRYSTASASVTSNLAACLPGRKPARMAAPTTSPDVRSAVATGNM